MLRKDLVNDVICRFLINLPEAELKPPRLFLNIQEAQWYFQDHLLDEQGKREAKQK